MITPFPRASPSAFTTTGVVFSAFTYSIALLGSLNTSYLAVGILYFFIRFFEKTFEASIIAAFALGPNARIPSACIASTIPSASGSSGATKTRSILFSLANLTMFSLSITPIFTSSASREIPPLPGAQ